MRRIVEKIVDVKSDEICASLALFHFQFRCSRRLLRHPTHLRRDQRGQRARRRFLVLLVFFSGSGGPQRPCGRKHGLNQIMDDFALCRRRSVKSERSLRIKNGGEALARHLAHKKRDVVNSVVATAAVFFARSVKVNLSPASQADACNHIPDRRNNPLLPWCARADNAGKSLRYERVLRRRDAEN
jgi:hypothetical protein